MIMKILYFILLTATNSFIFNPLRKTNHMLQQTFDDDDYFYFDPKNINNLNESDINQNNGFQT